MSKCETCRHITVCADYESKYKKTNCKLYECKPNRFEQFREQTATIDGWFAWQKEHHLDCLFCAYYPDECPCTTSQTQEEQDAYCEAGIKAYWESADEQDI